MVQCAKSLHHAIATPDTDFEVTDWTEAAHSNDADQNFDAVFDDTQVKRLDFVVTTERWQSMLDDMTATYGEFGVPAGSDGNLYKPEGFGAVLLKDRLLKNTSRKKPTRTRQTGPIF